MVLDNKIWAEQVDMDGLEVGNRDRICDNLNA